MATYVRILRPTILRPGGRIETSATVCLKHLRSVRGDADAGRWEITHEEPSPGEACDMCDEESAK